MNEKTQIEQSKKEWEKPQLIVLARGEPEEAVLGLCKASGSGSGPGGSCPVVAPCSAPDIS
jgi:hypothetical protein